MAHWQGYLSRDREFFGGLTEINRTPLGSIFLRENLSLYRDWRTTRVLGFLAPLSAFSSPIFGPPRIRFHQQTTNRARPACPAARV